MKPANFLAPYIYVAPTAHRGRGVFTDKDIPRRTIIEIAPVIVMGRDDRQHLDRTLLHDYIFEWGEEGAGCCMALGYVPLYNHSFRSNCEYEMDFNLEIITVKTVRKIKAGEELFINYGGDWNSDKPVWFPSE